MLFQLYGDGTIYKLIGWVLVFAGLVICNELARRSKFGGVLFFVFIGVSIFLIMNTIKLAVYSRRREVGIMKFVGATDWFIRWPFVIEGMIIGAVGSLLATALLYFIYRGVFGFIASNLLIANLVPVSFVLTTLLGGFLLGGIVVGAIGSIAALRKFLVV